MPERIRNPRMLERIRKVPNDVQEYIEQVHEITDRIFEVLEMLKMDQRDLYNKASESIKFN